jgi:hypothetical protein
MRIEETHERLGVAAHKRLVGLAEFVDALGIQALFLLAARYPY